MNEFDSLRRSGFAVSSGSAGNQHSSGEGGGQAVDDLGEAGGGRGDVEADVAGQVGLEELGWILFSLFDRQMRKIRLHFPRPISRGCLLA